MQSGGAGRFKYQRYLRLIVSIEGSVGHLLDWLDKLFMYEESFLIRYPRQARSATTSYATSISPRPFWISRERAEIYDELVI